MTFFAHEVMAHPSMSLALCFQYSGRHLSKAALSSLVSPDPFIVLTGIFLCSLAVSSTSLPLSFWLRGADELDSRLFLWEPFPPAFFEHWSSRLHPYNRD